jgi:hypothetical protein
MLLRWSVEKLFRAEAGGLPSPSPFLRIATLGSVAILILGAGSPATATINSIASDWCNSCLPGAVHRIVAGKQTSMLVKGQFVDLSTRVEINGSGVSVSFGDRTHGSNSSIEVKLNVDSSASLGERTVKLRYAIETNGPDTFKVQVVRGGHVDKIERLFEGRQLAVNALPVNQTVTLRFTGTRLGNAAIAPNAAVSNPHTLSNSETRFEVDLKLTRSGSVDINLFDADVGQTPGNLLFKFFYGGAKSVTVVGASSTSTTPAPVPRIPSGQSASPTPFVDVAPSAIIQNLFRVVTGSPVPFNTDNYEQVDDPSNQWCPSVPQPNPTGPPTFKDITLPSIVWGVSNVGTAEVNVAFDSQIFSDDQVYQDTKTIAAGTLHTGGTQTFNLNRPSNRQNIRVFKLPLHFGCFVRTTRASDFFSDPTFTVKVDIGNALPETSTNRLNNSRNY